MLRLKVLACKVLYREISLLSATCDNFIDVTYLRQGLHDTPDLLRQALQDEIDRIDEGSDLYSYEAAEGMDLDAILLGYGLCSNAICGLSSKKYKLVIPRAHDCITLFLGSKEWYKDYFRSHHGGVYWYTAGWIENCRMPGKDKVAYYLQQYTEKYGEENAQYLMDMEQNWLKEYNMCAFVDWPGLNNANHMAFTKECAEYLNWNFDVLQGETGLMENFLNGNWNPEDFLVLEPGQTVAHSFDDTILTAEA